MIVKACFKDNTHNYFRDIQTKTKRVFGDIFECDDEIAEERIKKGLVKKATKKEEKEYYDSLESLDNDDNTLTENERENETVDSKKDDENNTPEKDGEVEQTNELTDEENTEE